VTAIQCLLLLWKRARNGLISWEIMSERFNNLLKNFYYHFVVLSNIVYYEYPNHGKWMVNIELQSLYNITFLDLVHWDWEYKWIINEMIMSFPPFFIFISGGKSLKIIILNIIKLPKYNFQTLVLRTTRNINKVTWRGWCNVQIKKHVQVCLQ
jgi:hypothetical protein